MRRISCTHLLLSPGHADVEKLFFILGNDSLQESIFVAPCRLMPKKMLLGNSKLFFCFLSKILREEDSIILLRTHRCNMTGE
uniref:Ovule protein n=1 Tax=Strongyloides venezuelensis TaxID=75913 RepID=A0A0K0G5U5_STRVS